MHFNLILFCHILEALLQFHHQTHLDDTMIYKLRVEATREYFMWKMIADRDSSLDLIAPKRKNFLYVFMSAVFIPFSLFLSWPFLRIGILLDTTIPGFPQKPVGLLSLCPTEACGLWLTSRCVPTNSLEKTKNERKTGDYISTVPPEQQRSFFCSDASAQTSSQQTDPSMFRSHNAAHCMLFVYLNPGPRLPRLCHYLYPKTDKAWK